MSSSSLPTFLPIPVSIIAVLSAYVFYFFIEPRLDRPFPILYEFPYKPFRKFTFRRFIDCSIMVVMLTLFLILLTGPAVKPPTSWANIIYDLFMARANGDDSAHVFAYIVMPILFFYVWHREKDSCKAFLFVLFMAFFHETIWFIFYYLSYWSTIVDYSLLWQRDVSFLIFLWGLGAVWWFKYKQFNNVLKIGMVGLIVLCTYWYMIGFPITNVTAFNYSPSLAISATGQTRWFYDLRTNMIEVFYWWYALAVFMVAEWWQTRTYMNPLTKNWK